MDFILKVDKIFKKPTTKDSTVCDGGESFPPQAVKLRVVFKRGCLGRGTQTTRAHPARRLPGVWLFIAVKR